MGIHLEFLIVGPPSFTSSLPLFLPPIPFLPSFLPSFLTSFFLPLFTDLFLIFPVFCHIHLIPFIINFSYIIIPFLGCKIGNPLDYREPCLAIIRNLRKECLLGQPVFHHSLSHLGQSISGKTAELHITPMTAIISSFPGSLPDPYKGS